MRKIESLRNWYARFERPISSFSLVFGFIFDIITLKRIDTFWENVWVSGHLVMVAVFILLIHTQKNEAGDEEDPSKRHFWYVNILQFFFGGLLSTYLVFYFRSADIFTTWPFILLLSVAFIANESMKRHYVRFSFQISLLFLSIYSFAIYFLPIIFHKIGTWIFLLSGFASLVAISLFIAILFHLKKEEFRESKRLILSLVFGIFFLFNFLYFTNLIPPLPLSLKDGAIYHSVVKNQEGNYNVISEDHGVLGYFQFFKDFNVVSSPQVYAYSAIFSPSGLDITVVHEWQYFSEDERSWITSSKISLPIQGGRDGGFRTYSMRSNLSLGRWRVNVKTLDGKIIGRIRLNVIESEEMPTFKSEIK